MVLGSTDVYYDVAFYSDVKNFEKKKRQAESCTAAKGLSYTVFRTEVMRSQKYPIVVPKLSHLGYTNIQDEA